MSQRGALIPFILVLIVGALIGGWFLISKKEAAMPPQSLPTESEIFPVPTKDTAGTADSTKDWKVYRGDKFEFRYSPNWSISDGSFGIPQTDVLLYVYTDQMVGNVINIMTDDDLFVQLTEAELQELLYPGRHVVRRSETQGSSASSASVREVTFDSMLTWLIVVRGSKKVILESRESTLDFARIIARALVIYD